jgi:hypothetical protein
MYLAWLQAAKPEAKPSQMVGFPRAWAWSWSVGSQSPIKNHRHEYHHFVAESQCRMIVRLQGQLRLSLPTLRVGCRLLFTIHQIIGAMSEFENNVPKAYSTGIESRLASVFLLFGEADVMIGMIS